MHSLKNSYSGASNEPSEPGLMTCYLYYCDKLCKDNTTDKSQFNYTIFLIRNKIFRIDNKNMAAKLRDINVNDYKVPLF